MATSDSLSKFDGNGYLLEAAKLLAMVPEWKEKPGKLREGLAQLSVRASRYLVNAYVKAEGLPDKKKFELFEQIQPRLQEMKAAVQAGREARGVVQPEETTGGAPACGEVPAVDTGYSDFIQALNTWHVEMACAVDGLRYLLDQVDYDSTDPLGGLAYIVKGRAQELIEHCPFPKV